MKNLNIYKLKLNNNKGFSLIELVVTLGVLSIVMICAAMLVGFIAKGYKTAEELASNRNNVNNFAALITQEFRRCSYDDIVVDSEQSFHIGTDFYKCASNGVTKNGVVIANGISEIKITFNDADKTIKIEIKSTHETAANPFTHTSTLYMRS